MREESAIVFQFGKCPIPSERSTPIGREPKLNPDRQSQIA